MNLKKDLCSGCEACYSICPRNAITMEENSEGFRYPVIDKALCTNCGLCEKICHGEKFINNKNPECYAYMADDDIRKKSASGGVFPVLAYHFINNGGYVCGAVWDSDWSVKHIVSNKAEDIEKMRSSKYLQSRIENCYKEIKALLDRGTKVLFTGTPCQVNGLKSFLRKDYKNLFCVDLICHGVPSAKVFKKYLQENFQNVEYFNFRDKGRNGWGVEPAIIANGGTKIYIDDCDYYKLFLANSIFRKCCTQCNFNRIPRQGDITIGDFCGIANYKKKMDDGIGTSVITVNNTNGQQLLKILMYCKPKLLKKVPVKYAIRSNGNLYRASTLHPNRNLFFNNLDRLTVKENCQIAIEDKCDCMVLNFWYSVNYGAALTGYGVICLLKKLGLNAKTINYVSALQDLNYKGSFSEKFAQKYMNLSKRCESYDDFLNLNKNCKNFIVGSDQVWADFVTYSHHTNVTKSIYYLDFVQNGGRKLAYSASFGAYKYESSNEDRAIFRHFVEQFDAISVRESFGKDILKNEFGLDSTQLIDGAFHIPYNELLQMTDEYPAEKEKYVAYFCLPYYELSSAEENIAVQISKKLQLPLKKVLFDKTMPVEQWLSIIRNAEFVVSDSYHAAVFSIIFNRPFVQIVHAKSQDRFESLFNLLELENNSVYKFDTELDFNKIFVKRDWEKVNRIIRQEVQRAEDWMKNALSLTVKDRTNYNAANYLITKSLLKNEQLEERFYVSLNRDKIYRRYLRYKILSKIMSGKKRAYYTEKRDKFKKYVKILRENKLR